MISRSLPHRVKYAHIHHSRYRPARSRSPAGCGTLCWNAAGRDASISSLSQDRAPGPVFERGGQRANRPRSPPMMSLCPLQTCREAEEEACLVLRGGRPARDTGRGAIGAALRAHQARHLAPYVRRLRARLARYAARHASRWAVRPLLARRLRAVGGLRSGRAQSACAAPATPAWPHPRITTHFMHISKTRSSSPG